MKNYLIVGKGWVGLKMAEEMTKRGHTIRHVSHKNVFSVLYQEKFDWVINCAGVTGYPNVDACEDNKVETLRGNTIFPIELYEECNKLNIRMSHVSSGCIYSGNIFDTNTDPNYFGSIYSVSKGISDMYLKTKAQVYRIRMPFTGIMESKNYLTKVINYAKTGKLIDFGQNSLTDLDEAVIVACDLIETEAPNAPYNLVNSGSITMHRLVELLGIDVSWFTEEEFKHVTKAGRSTCVIPSFEKMSPIEVALQKRISTLKF